MLEVYFFVPGIIFFSILRTPPLQKNPPRNIWRIFVNNKNPPPKIARAARKILGFWGIYKGKTLKKRVKKYGKNKNPPQTFGQIL